MISDRARVRSVRWTALFLAMGLAWAALVRAAPIVYAMVVFVDPRETNFAPISGTLNGTAFGGAGKDVVMTFTFIGDTTDVIPFNSPVVGAENLLGSSSVQINSATSGGLLARTRFLPSAGIFVSADNTNGGLGFGSFGALPSSPGFPGNPVYPYAANFIFGLTSSYDLVTYEKLVLYNNVSCINFPFACSPGAPLPTAAGSLVVNPVFGDGWALFFARPQAFLFGSFSAGTSVSASGVMTMSGSFSLASGRRSLNPETVPVTLGMITASGSILPDLTIPSGSFQLVNGVYEFTGFIDSASLSVKIRHTEENRYVFDVTGSGGPLAAEGPGTHPISVTLMVGDDFGTTTATTPRHSEE